MDSAWFLGWCVCGALIGFAASQARGYSAAAGLLGGLLLGPLAVLMFAVSTVTRAGRNVKCPHCAEWVKPEAKVCKHCQRDIVEPER
jgi:hypothetical protein